MVDSNNVTLDLHPADEIIPGYPGQFYRHPCLDLEGFDREPPNHHLPSPLDTVKENEYTIRYYSQNDRVSADREFLLMYDLAFTTHFNSTVITRHIKTMRRLCLMILPERAEEVT
jgi:hypothetical protein